jgi:hypothetical protein
MYLLFLTSKQSVLCPHDVFISCSSYNKQSLGSSRRKGRPRLRWVDDLEEDLKKIGIRGWRRMAEDREGWRQAIAEVQALQGL